MHPYNDTGMYVAPIVMVHTCHCMYNPHAPSCRRARGNDCTAAIAALAASINQQLEMSERFETDQEDTKR